MIPGISFTSILNHQRERETSDISGISHNFFSQEFCQIIIFFFVFSPIFHDKWQDEKFLRFNPMDLFFVHRSKGAELQIMTDPRWRAPLTPPHPLLYP
jgi:hypothetical protein